MKKILLLSAAALAMASCSNKGAADAADSVAADSAVLTDSVTTDTAIADTIPADTMGQDTLLTEGDPFMQAIPDPSQLCMEAASQDLVGRYLTELGYHAVEPEKWRFEDGKKSIEIEEEQPENEKEASFIAFEVEIKGDPAALEAYYQKALELERSGFGFNYSVQRKGNKVITKEVPA